jgi:hypothetical protein
MVILLTLRRADGYLLLCCVWICECAAALLSLSQTANESSAVIEADTALRVIPALAWFALHGTALQGSIRMIGHACSIWQAWHLVASCKLCILCAIKTPWRMRAFSTQSIAQQFEVCYLHHHHSILAILTT